MHPFGIAYRGEGGIVYFPGGSTPIVSIDCYSVNKIIIFLDVFVLSTYYKGNKASFKAHTTNNYLENKCNRLYLVDSLYNLTKESNV